MVSQYAVAYRGILRELRKSLNPSRKVNPVIRNQFREAVEGYRKANNKDGLTDLSHTVLFLTSQREHKRLLERYNPLIDFTEQERIKATARRVGLDIPEVPKASKGEEPQ